MKEKDFRKYKYYENRELSWLKFNERVLSEAEDSENPLFERLKFLSITASNLDEFVMVRVATLCGMIDTMYSEPDIAGMTPQKQLDAINKEVRKLVSAQYKVYNDMLWPALMDNGIKVIKRHEDLSEREKEYVDEFFEKEVYPVLTPMAVDSSRPFPLIRNKSLNIGALVTKKAGDIKSRDVDFATVQVPGGLQRIVELPHRNGAVRSVILLEEVIERNLSKLFLNYNIVYSAPFRILRNADLSIDEDETVDLLEEIERQVRMRQWGEANRLEVPEGIHPKLLDILKENLNLPKRAIFEISGPLDLTFLMKMYGLDGYSHLKEHSYREPQECPQIPDGENIFDIIDREDVLLYHPYQSFKPVVDFIRQASTDPQVLAIKQTLYRVSGNSPIIAALAQAAENGKQVTVLVELKARFDEENNIIWARRLEKAGCHVIYGLVGLKTHSKITLVVRRNEDGIKRYVHLGTGNYNDSTAKLYTDIGLLTADEAIGEDATAVFNMLSGYSEPLNWNKLVMAPLWLKDKLLFLIGREKEYALKGEKAHIIAKMNSICDPDIINALYEAAYAGVKIDLIVRGICCLKVGIPELEGRISVRSIVGNYLEHARIFYFENGGNEELYAASADWMPRNLDRRVEIMFPLKGEFIKDVVKEILDIQLRDTQKAHLLMPDGKYVRVKDTIGKDSEQINSQLVFGQNASEAVVRLRNDQNSRVFIPRQKL